MHFYTFCHSRTLFPRQMDQIYTRAFIVKTFFFTLVVFNQPIKCMFQKLYIYIFFLHIVDRYKNIPIIEYLTMNHKKETIYGVKLNDTLEAATLLLF